jgi:hypothetical protein
MELSASQTRLASVDSVRSYQRKWLEETRLRVLAGDHFAICNADDFEEIFTAFDVPCLVINYWNSIVTFSERKGPHYDEVLEAHGFVPNRFAHGLGTTLDPSKAPWGGLPKPTLIVGTTRDEAQLRVTELWAEAFGCECYPLDFSWVSQFTHELPADWWNYHRSRSESMVDLDRVELRLEQMKGLIAHLEARLGRPFSLARFRETMELLNEQMDAWEAARDLVANARPLPVSLRDQMALYQVTWQRGTRANLELVKAYHEEVKSLVAAKTGCYAQERFRLYLATSGNDPLYHNYLRERHGGAIVSNRYSSIALMYARTIHDDDPLRALATRQLFLFDKEPVWEVEEARRWGADGIIGLETDPRAPSRYRDVCEAAGLPYLALPRDDDSAEVRALIDEYVGTRMTVAPEA